MPNRSSFGVNWINQHLRHSASLTNINVKNNSSEPNLTEQLTQCSMVSNAKVFKNHRMNLFLRDSYQATVDFQRENPGPIEPFFDNPIKKSSRTSTETLKNHSSKHSSHISHRKAGSEDARSSSSTATAMASVTQSPSDATLLDNNLDSTTLNNQLSHSTNSQSNQKQLLLVRSQFQYGAKENLFPTGKFGLKRGFIKIAKLFKKSSSHSQNALPPTPLV
ncbi:hypothetical protein CONCODRAFT_77057, partial [Conidiobolus coronatus NRRL 28638]